MLNHCVCLKFLYVFGICLYVTFGEDPLALHKLVVVTAGAEVVIALPGYDLDGDNLVTKIASLPDSGDLHQLSQVFSDYGYQPQAGSTITSAPVVVSGSNNRVVYQRPTSDVAGYEKWATFTYTVEDANKVAKAATVTLVPPSGALVGSNFLLSSEGWTVNGNGAVTAVVYDSSSRGPQLNRFVQASDSVVNAASSGADDRQLWYFQAPAKFLGNQGIAYGGYLDFVLSSFSGDFSATQQNSDLHLVVLHCSKCNVNRGVTLAFPLAAVTGGFAGSVKSFSLLLKEGAGWVKDPKNTLKEWTAPSKCDFIEVLSGLTSVRILGDFTRWHETVALDNVVLRNSKGQLPVCAQGSPDASVCSC